MEENPKNIKIIFNNKHEDHRRRRRLYAASS
jgi:hypothetical protein